METYLFQGIVRPERASLTLQLPTLDFAHLSSGVQGKATISILMNQIAVWVESEHVWNVFDLRNVVKDLVQNYLAMVGYLMGYAYDLEITRVLNQGRGIDQVFGIDIPCLSERDNSIDLKDAFLNLQEKTIGPNGVLLFRCFSDLVSSMKHADDTGFYCYRAIESLRQHCAAVHHMTADDKPGKHWEKFREVSGCDEKTLRMIKAAADPVRHGGVTGVSSEDREKLFKSTWDVVRRYLDSLDKGK